MWCRCESRLPWFLPLLLLLGPVCSAPPGPAAPRPAGSGTLVIVVQGFASDEGQALVNLFLSAAGFPGDPRQAFRAVEREIRDRRVEIELGEVPAGPFAVSAFHDQDRDYELDTGLLGIPTESWGVSRAASGFLGPPSYEDAILYLEPGEREVVVIEVG